MSDIIASNLMKKIEQFQKSEMDIYMRKILNEGTQIYILCIQALTDRKMLSQFVIDPILKYDKSFPVNVDNLVNSTINIDDIQLASDEEEILNYLLKGYSVIIIATESKYIVANTIKIEKRTTQSPEVEQTILGARDSFTENINSNLSLIRYRIKDSSLTINRLSVGERTKTNVAVIYLKDVANPQYVENIINKIRNIKVDGVLESGVVQKFLLNSPFDLFPQNGLVEKSDTACKCILDGKICIIVEGGIFALIAPKTFIEYFVSSDDNYSPVYLVMFIKILRYICVFIYTGLSALYISVVAYNFDILPPQYALTLAQSRATVPFNAVVEILLMELIAEILRESSIRLPKQVGPAIGIVGTIVIGQAAVVAGVVSPLVIIITALSLMSSFTMPDFTVLNPLRVLKFLIIISTAILGLFGYVMMCNIIIIKLVSQESLGIPLSAPVTPFNFSDWKSIFLSDSTLQKDRLTFLKTKDKKRKE